MLAVILWLSVGIAHTYMAARKYIEKLLKVERHRKPESGNKTNLGREQSYREIIQEAGCVLIAVTEAVIWNCLS